MRKILISLCVYLLIGCTTSQTKPNPCDTKEFKKECQDNWNLVLPMIYDWPESLKADQFLKMQQEMCADLMK